MFGISVRKKQRDDKIKNLLKETEDLKEQNLKLTFEISKLKKDMGKVCLGTLGVGLWCIVPLLLLCDILCAYNISNNKLLEYNYVYNL